MPSTEPAGSFGSTTSDARHYYEVVYTLRGRPNRLRRNFFAVDRSEILNEIRAAGGTPITIKERRLSSIDRQFVLNSHRLAFLRAMLSYVRGGNTPTISLQKAIDLTRNVKMRAQIQPAAEILRRGGDFLSAVQALRMFDRATVAFLDASARGGRLASTLPGLIEHLEHKARITKTVMGNMTVVFAEFITAFVSVLAMELGGFDMLSSFVGEASQGGMAAFEEALATARMINWALMAIAIIPLVLGAAVFFALRSSDERAQAWAGRVIGRIPLLKDLFLAIGITETFSIVARMMEAGVRLQDAMRTAMRSTVLAQLKRYWERALTRVENGAPLCQAFSSRLLSEPEDHTIRSLTTRDHLVETLDQIARERRHGAIGAGKRMAFAGFWIVMVYIVAVVGTMAWVTMAQNDVLMDGLNTITGN